jgi:hypothetical protein
MKKCYAGYVKGLGFNNWRYCYLCHGRIHDSTCTAKVDPAKDCCIARHVKMGLPPEEAQVRCASMLAPDKGQAAVVKDDLGSAPCG